MYQCVLELTDLGLLHFHFSHAFSVCIKRPYCTGYVQILMCVCVFVSKCICESDGNLTFQTSISMSVSVEYGI